MLKRFEIHQMKASCRSKAYHKFLLSYVFVFLLIFSMHIIHHHYGRTPSFSFKKAIIFYTWLTWYSRCSNNKSDAMKSVSLVEAKTLKIKCPLHSRLALLCKQWRQKCWKKVYAQDHSEMQMIPLRKGRQTYCVIFIVLMVTGAIKLIVRHKSAMLFENGRAKSLFITRGQITIDDQAKQGILY